MPPELFENRRARVRALARDLGRTETRKATPRGEPKGGRRRRRREGREESSRALKHQGNSSAHAKGMEEMEREGRDASDGGGRARAGAAASVPWCIHPPAQRAPPPATHQARGAGEQLLAGPGGRHRGWLVAEPDVAGPWRRRAGPGCRWVCLRPRGALGQGGGGEGRGGSDGFGRGGHHRLRRTGGGCAAGGARGHKWDGDGWSLRAPASGRARRWPAGTGTAACCCSSNSLDRGIPTLARAQWRSIGVIPAGRRQLALQHTPRPWPGLGTPGPGLPRPGRAAGGCRPAAGPRNHEHPMIRSSRAPRGRRRDRPAPLPTTMSNCNRLIIPLLFSTF